MKHRGTIAGPAPLPDPREKGAEKALLNDARLEVENGTEPAGLLERWKWRNTVTKPPWSERDLCNTHEREILNNLFDELNNLWIRHNTTPTPDLDPQEQFEEDESKRAANVQCRRVMELLGCSYQRAYTIMTNGTALPAQAKTLAAGIARTTEADWLRTAMPAGRKPPPAAPAIKALRIDGCSLFDFIVSLPRDSKLDQFNETVGWLKAAYRSGEPPERHFESLAHFKRALPAGIDTADAEETWDAYKVWRADRIKDALDADLLDPRS